MFKKVKTRLFNRYLFSIFCVVAIAVILVTLLIFTIYANLQISSARTYSVHQLEQVCQMTDTLYSQMRSVNNQILQNSNTNPLPLLQYFQPPLRSRRRHQAARDPNGAELYALC